VALVKDLPNYQRLTSVSGTGPINALTILAQAGDLRRFAHHRQFLTFCEMDRATIQSGAFHGQTKRSKYANTRLRRTLWMAGQVAILQRANSFRDKFERTSRRTATTPICAAKRIPQSPPRRPVLFLGSLNMANLTCPFFAG
jgi:transposase